MHHTRPNQQGRRITAQQPRASSPLLSFASPPLHSNCTLHDWYPLSCLLQADFKDLVSMFTLLSGLWKYIFQKDEYCVLIVGLDNAGKTTLLEQVKRKYSQSYKGIPLEKISSTVGMNVGKIEVSQIRLILWDLGGQQELQSLWDKYFLDCHAVIYVIDSCDSGRLEESYAAFEGIISCSELDGVPLLVLANKQDKTDALTVADIKSTFNRSSHRLGKRDCLVQPISAFDGDGIDAGVDWLVNCVIRNIHRPPREQVIT